MILAVVGLALADERSPHWPSVRRAHLAREPACMYCGTTNEPEVHHIIPFHVQPGLELVASNLITLCTTPGTNCHFVHGHLRSWTNWNPNVRRDVPRGEDRPMVEYRAAVTLDMSRVVYGMTNLVLCPEPITNKTAPFDTMASWTITPVWETGTNAAISARELQGIELTNTVNQLVKDGHVCAVIGHRWMGGCGKEGCLVMHYGNMRYCTICGKTQTQEPGVWK